MKKLTIIPFLYICIFGITQNISTSQIIGNPIPIDKLLVAQNDFPFKMNWDDAKDECKKLGKGWKLPTKKELNILYQNKIKLSEFHNDFYWSTSDDFILNQAWSQNFLYGSQNLDNKFENYHVRAIKVLK